jgi:hypothetical protein
VDQFVEFVFRANGTGISAQSIGGIVLYDGATGYSTLAHGVADATFFDDSDDANVGYVVWDIGELPDGLSGVALVDNCNTVLQFVSYEGTFLGKEGVAKDLVSTDIGYGQSGDGAAGHSLQRIGIGFEQSRDNNQWVHAKATRGKANALQTFGTCKPVRFYSSGCFRVTSFILGGSHAACLFR